MTEPTRPHAEARPTHPGAADSALKTRVTPIVVAARRALADAWALIAPVDCAGCGAPDRALCPACAFELQSRPLLGELALSLPAALPSPSDGRPQGAATLPVVAALPYEGVARRVMLAFKEQGRTELARSLAGLLTEAVETVWRGTRAELLVPVPGSWAARGTRGFDPVAVIARRAGFTVTPALRALRPTTGPHGSALSQALHPHGFDPTPRSRDADATQKSRTLAERLTADAPRWRISPRVRGRRVILIDDVVTSGATLRAAVLALSAAGAEVAGCAAIAATPRRVGASSIPWRFMGIDDQGPHDNRPGEDYRGRKEA